MKYLLVFFLFLNINSCYDEFDSVDVQDDKAGDIAMSAVSDISNNILEIGFLGTSCMDWAGGVYCDTPLSETTSVREIRIIVDNFLESDNRYTQVDDRLISERNALYTDDDGSYDVRIILSHKRILLFVAEEKA